MKTGNNKLLNKTKTKVIGFQTREQWKKQDQRHSYFPHLILCAFRGKIPNKITKVTEDLGFLRKLVYRSL